MLSETREGCMSGSERSTKTDEGAGENAAIIEALGALREYLASKPEVRDALRVLAKHVLGEDPIDVKALGEGDGAKPRAEVEKVSLTLSIGGITRDVAVPAQPPREAQVCGPRVVLRESSDVPGLSTWDPSPRVDGRKVAARCRLKAEGCRWVGEQRKLQQAGANYQDERIRPVRESLVSRAKAINPCYLWMVDPRGPALPDDVTLGVLAECYEAVAAAVELVVEVISSDEAEEGGGLESAMALAAEAQCMLRVALAPVGFDDHDQTQAHVLLRQLAEERRVLIRRYMRLNETADLSRVGELEHEIVEAGARRRGNAERTRRRRALYSKAKYHAERLCRAEGPDTHDLERLWEAVEGLLEEGVPPSDRELREILVPVVEARDEEELRERESLAAVWRELERHFAEKEESRAAKTAAGAAAAELSPVVLQVRRLLEGKRVLLIGGLRRPNHQRALEQAFGLAELIWPATRPHQSIDDFEADVRHERTALVLLAIRWSSHSFGDVERLCDRWGKPFVRLPGGYNPEQVAAQIIQQASGKLAALAATTAVAVETSVVGAVPNGK